MPRRLLGALAAAALLAAGCGGSPAPARSGTDTGSATSGGQAAAAAPAAGRHPVCGWKHTPSYRHVVWIWMENRTYDSVLGSAGTGDGGDAPQLAAYARKCGLATDYQAITHPSLPNYIAATAGDTRGVSTDCSPADCPVAGRSLFAQVAAAGKGWHGYAESMQARCDRDSYDTYAARHNPAVYYTAITAACARRDVPMGGAHGRFARALADDRLPAFSFVTPNLCHDGHDCATGTADDWLGRWLDRITASKAYGAGHTVVFVTWDEGVGADNHIATVVIGPTVTRGTRSGRAFTHYSLLRTTEQLLGLPYLRNAATAHSMRRAFGL